MSITTEIQRVWRLKTKPPGMGSSDRKLLIAKMLNENFIGTGWSISQVIEGKLTREKSVELLTMEALNSHKVAVRFVKDTALGDLVWIVDLDGKYHLGCIDGEYRYQAGNTNWEKELVHQFPCRWMKNNLYSSDVPSGIKNALRQGQAYCRIRNNSAAIVSQVLAQGKAFEARERDEFLALIDDEALEDLVGLYLQMELNGFLLPSSAKRSNNAYEFVIVSRTGGRRATAQVKSGASSIDTALQDDTDHECYLFAVNGSYPSELKNNKIIAPNTLVNFAYQNRAILPATISCWMVDNH